MVNFILKGRKEVAKALHIRIKKLPLCQNKQQTMINGHGDDLYQYDKVQMNFSSNICQHADLEALKAHLASRLSLIGNYPEPEAWSLERMIACQEGIPAECVIATSGATEAIYLTAQAFRYHYDLPWPTFSEYADALKMFPPQCERTGLWLCNPNNPTGDVFDNSYIADAAQRHDLIVIDQSYEDYTDSPLLSVREAVKMGKVIQLHSLTKAYGIPGLRLGYITAAAPLTEQIRRYLRPWAVNALAIEAGKFLLKHGAKLTPDLQESKRLAQMLRRIGQITVGNSHTNFMLCEIYSHTAAELKDYLVKKHGILIRDASNFKGLTPHHFRIAAQTPAENEALVAAIQSFIINEE